MSADPKQVLRILGSRGIDVRLVNGRLVGRARYGEMPGDMTRFIRHFKDLIVTELVERQWLEETVHNIVNLTPDELVQYRQELTEAPQGDPWITHDREALRIASKRMKEERAAV